MTAVIMVLLALTRIGMFTSRKMDDWKLGRAASESLRSVYSAQRMYLADNPTVLVENIAEVDLIPYIPNVKTPLPTTLTAALGNPVKSLTGATLGFNFTTANSSPFLTLSGVRYDPSGTYTDSLWDVGE